MNSGMPGQLGERAAGDNWATRSAGTRQVWWLASSGFRVWRYEVAGGGGLIGFGQGLSMDGDAPSGSLQASALVRTRHPLFLC